jgi:UDP-glucuronate decarboxylase
MIKLMGSSYFEPVNIGNPIEMTMKDLALYILKLTNSNSKIVFKELPMDDPKRRKPNIDLAKSKLNWEPSVSIELGLTKTIGYFRDLL